MATVYLVTEGSYSDYSVLGAYSTREKALEAKEFFDADNDIEEFELDHLPESKVPQGQLAYMVIMGVDGNVTRVSRRSNERAMEGKWHPYGDNLHVVFDVFAKDDVHAVKIANERRIALKASDQLETDWSRWKGRRGSV